MEYANDKVSSISAVSFAAGGKFQGKILGLTFADDFDDCEDRFGEYQFSEDLSICTIYSWYYEGNTVQAEILNESGVWTTGNSY